jgi:hypothetical protein
LKERIYAGCRFFFAEPPNGSTEEHADMFWDEVTSSATEIFRTRFNKYERYITVDFRRKMSAKYEELQPSFQPWIPGSNVTLILLFDEARRLCEFSAYDGKKIPNDDCYDKQGNYILSRESETAFLFSNFQGLRQGLRYTLLCELKPRIFNLFTDTGSPISNLTRPLINHLELFKRYPPGVKQFEPIFAFTSLDAHARIHCSSRCLSNIDEASDPERLIKFGRAGWYSTYRGKMKEDISSTCEP